MITNQKLLDYIKLLKEKGFRVFTTYYASARDNTTFIWFSKDDRIGYCQISYHGGFDYSTVHKPSKENGTGFSMNTGVDASIQYALNTLNSYTEYPEYLKGTTIVKYKTLQEFINMRNKNEITELTEL